MHFLLAVSFAGLLLDSVDPALAKAIWSDKPGDYANFISTALPLGNGRLGAMPLGTFGKEIVNLNVDSLWRGGPFENESYMGGNPAVSRAGALPGIRDFIFQNGTGNVSALLGNSNNYGSYQVLANLTVDLGDLGSFAEFKMTLDLETAVYTSSFVVDDASYEREAFCSYPDQVCVYRISSNISLPSISIGLENQLVSPALRVACKDGSISLNGQTAGDIGMIYNARAMVIVPGAKNIQSLCSTNGSEIVVPKGQSEVITIIAAGTNYDPSKGNSASGYSFKGEDPSNGVLHTVTAASKIPYTTLKGSHISDHSAIFKRCTLTLPDTRGSSKTPTKKLLESYDQDGDPFIENLLFDYGRYLFISSSRPGSLPPNLQGLWTEQFSPSWSADYHANINIQMSHWTVEQTGLGDETEPLWRYMMETWMPRGAETAELLYGTSQGWTTHDEMNIFGHTAMKDSATWADYPVANAWMSQHVWDHFDYSQDRRWYQKVGYPILKGTAQFWLSQLVEDKYFNDGTWVVNPCNSPEHGPTTFGCTHFQQLIHEVFDHVLRGWDASGDTDTAFKTSVQRMVSQLDKGVHVGSWGQIQEWKLDIDTKNDTHRHLSQLYGWYPGYSISSLYSQNNTVTDAVATTLYSRGSGIEDQDTGWGKMWRSACWALLNNTAEAYYELTLAIQHNFAGNGFDMYNGGPPFQIDANFGLTAAVMSMLIRDLDRASTDTTTQAIVLGPAIPSAWGGGSIEGARLRGGGTLGFSWDVNGLVTACKADLSRRGGDVPKVAFFIKGGESISC